MSILFLYQNFANVSLGVQVKHFLPLTEKSTHLDSKSLRRLWAVENSMTFPTTKDVVACFFGTMDDTP
jgi:hypothetical protein